MIEKRVRSIVGSGGEIDFIDTGTVSVAPHTEEECALILAAAHQKRWKVCLEGGGNWITPGGRVDLQISTRQLKGIPDHSPDDMVLTALAGTQLDTVHRVAAEEGMWIALDPPGANRSLGSVVATGTSGPLTAGFGAIKSRILGLTLITADGRILKVGGRVVKNVAGFDITSLAVGSFGAFGLITSANVRLNALPKADMTLIAHASRDELLSGARAVLSAGRTPASMELLSPVASGKDEWTLAMRLLGSEAKVETDQTNISSAVANVGLEVVEQASSADFWASISTRATEPPTTVRLGAKSTELSKAVDLVFAELGGSSGEFVSVSVLTGTVRWSGETSTPQLANLRRPASQQSWPVTLERAPREVLHAVGHYGEYRSGVGRLVASLRNVFDPRGTLACPLSGAS